MSAQLDWYIGMMLVYAGRLCSPRKAYAHYATIKQRHVVPIAICDYLGTVGTTIGLELAGSAIFGIIFSSVTVWTCVSRRSRSLDLWVAMLTQSAAG